MKSIYHTILAKQIQTERALSRRSNGLGLLRLLAVVAFVACLWFCIEKFDVAWLVGMGIALLGFLTLLKVHEATRYKLALSRALIQINEAEIDFLENGHATFADGAEFLPKHHINAPDLDLLGPDSLYQHLNRCSTVMGKQQLAALLLNRMNAADIENQQNAVRELTNKVEFRQQLQAIGLLVNDNPSTWSRLKSWSEESSDQLSLFVRVASFVGPILLAGSIAAFVLSGQILFRHISIGLFLTNLYLLQLQLKRIKHELEGTGKVDEIVSHYGRMAAYIEKENFSAPVLKNLQCCPGSSGKGVSQQLKKLSGHFRNLETVTNLLAAVIFDGLFLYHLHVLHSLLKWKRDNARHLPEWLHVIGEAEATGCLANFSANNPEFAFPEMAQKPEFTFSNLGHPLIRSHKRVCNNVSFDQQRFVVLTGSNMSGKSTFLRTLGVNLVLANTGAPVCATQARLFPVDVLTSIHQSDSLNENESYFFAEVKRLKEIMDAAEGQTVFILLDEILRGTNSDDKRNGTLEVIKKLAAKNCYGVVATHDLEICNLTAEYPGVLANQCFEVEIINNDLSFDYKLREGVCRNKSATFLMKKMGII